MFRGNSASRILGTVRCQVLSVRSLYGHVRCNSSQPFDPLSTYRKVDPPNPHWRLGQPVDTHTQQIQKASGKRKTWDFTSSQTAEIRNIYRVLTSAIVPRPIALVSSISEDGIPNLAPFSYFSMLSHTPPLVSVSFSLSPRRPKDTRNNILDTKEFTISIVSEAIVGPANSASVEAPAEVDEWGISGLTQERSTLVKPPFVLESPVAMECELHSYHDIHVGESGDPTTTVVFGLIKMLHVKESILNKEGSAIDIAKLRPVARLGGTSYARILEGFDLPRISWKSIRDEYMDKRR